MVKIAILAAAGWKGAGCNMSYLPGDIPRACLPLDTCPESLLPIGAGQTILSRTVGILEEYGFEAVFIAVGRPGCLYPNGETLTRSGGRLVKKRVGAGAKTTPWTWERLRYVNSLGIPMLMPNPVIANYGDSYIRVLDMISHDSWNRAYIQPADLLISKEFLRHILKLKLNSMLTLHRYHDIFQLDSSMVGAFQRALGPHRLLPHYPQTSALLEIGIKQILVEDKFPEYVDHWYDVDYDFLYQYVVEGDSSWITKYG